MSRSSNFNRFLLALPMTALLAACAGEQQPVVSEADILAREQARLDANKQLLLDFFAFRGTPEERVERFLADEYIQHNPRFLRMDELTGHHDTGRAWLEAMQMGRELGVQLTDNRIPRRDPVVLIAEDDLVIGLYRGELPDPDDASRTFEAFAFQAVRIQDGKFVEHWDGVMLEEGWMEGPEPAAAAADAGMTTEE